MSRYSRLSPLGVSGRFIGVVAVATGTMACGGTLAGVSADIGGDGAIASTSTWSGVGRSTAAATGLVLGRWLDVGGVGSAVVASTGSLPALVQIVGSSGGQIGRLTGYGVTGRFFSPAPKESSVPREWNVSETFGLNLGISDFTERRFFLCDEFGLNLAQTAVFTGAVGAATATATWAGVSLVTAEVTGSAEAVSAWSGVGQNVIISEGDGDLAVVVTFSGQGSEAGGVHGVGVGSLPVVGTLTGVGRSNAAAVASLDAVGTFTGVAEAVFAADGALAAVSNWDEGHSTTFLGGAGAIAIASDWTGGSLSVTAPTALLEARSTWAGVAILANPAEARRNRHDVIRRSDRSTQVVRKSRRTSI